MRLMDSSIKNARCARPSVLNKYKWNFNNIQRGNYMRKTQENKRVNHLKDVLRDQFYQGVNPAIAVPLREILNRYKTSEKSK